MNVSSTFDQLHLRARRNKWLGYFAIFNRIALAAGFLPSGLQKVIGERFTVLAVNHPMGNFLEAFYHTGYYYTFVGLMQVTAAILLLIPRTATLGAVIYFPIILNICVLSQAVRFDGSQVTSPLMVLAVLYLLCWDYHKLKFIFPFNHSRANASLPRKDGLSKKFPVLFFAGVTATVLMVMLHTQLLYNILPRNTISDCRKQCTSEENKEDCFDFCNCIHQEGQSLDKCLAKFHENTGKSREPE